MDRPRFINMKLKNHQFYIRVIDLELVGANQRRWANGGVWLGMGHTRLTSAILVVHGPAVYFTISLFGIINMQ